MGHSPKSVKQDLKDFYENQSSEKTKDFQIWLNSGSLRIPQPKSYYYFEDRKISNALEMANLPEQSKILEIGCSLGQQTFVLGEMGFHITGIDISPNSIEKACLRAEHYGKENISFEVLDAGNIQGHEDGSFDAVFSFSAFRYLTKPIVALKEANRLLKNGGCAVIDFPNKYCPWFNILKPALLMKKHIHDNLFTIPQVREFMEVAGFKNIEFRKFLFSNKMLPSVLLPLMKLADFTLERIPLIRSTAAIIMVKGIKS